MKKERTIALITGVSRQEGIGFGLAKAMAEKSFEVIITARDALKAVELSKTITNLNGAVTGGQLDVTDDSSIATMVKLIERKFGRLDILINNASAPLDFMQTPLEMNLENTKQTFETTLFGSWRMIKALYPLLKKSEHPRIVNISSGAGSFTNEKYGMATHPAIVTSYGLSKLALNGLTVQFARQFKKDGILVNAVNPGLVATAPGMREMGARSVEESTAGIIWAATLQDDGPTGGFFEDGKQIGW